MTTTWLFDIGNTRLKCAPLDARGRVGDVQALPHAQADVDAALAAALPARFDIAVVASVAGTALTVAVLDALTRHCRHITRVRTPHAWGGVRIAYARPERLGVDRFLALLGAHEAGIDRLVCGVGTALTIDLLDRDGLHRGGRIAPSPALMRDALHARAPHLPADGGRYVEFAGDTDDALASGCDGAALALLDRSVHEARALLGRDVDVLLHGGGADTLRAQRPDAQWRPHLVVEGLAHWARADAGIGFHG